MSKPFKKERKGGIQGAVSSPHSMALEILSPEEEQRFQNLVDRLQPIIAQKIAAEINVFIDDSINNNIDLRPIIFNIVNQYITDAIYVFLRMLVHGGDGIKATPVYGGVLIEVDRATSLGTTANGSGLGFSGGKLQVAPEDFLYTG